MKIHFSEEQLVSDGFFNTNNFLLENGPILFHKPGDQGLMGIQIQNWIRVEDLNKKILFKGWYPNIDHSWGSSVKSVRFFLGAKFRDGKFVREEGNSHFSVNGYSYGTCFISE